jgi:hypothetical protein
MNVSLASIAASGGISLMTLFNDEALWAAAESSLSPAQQRRLNQLTHADGSRLLTAAESGELAYLLDLFNRHPPKE